MTINAMKCTAAMLAALALTACTLDDPEDSKSAGDNSRLSYISVYGAKAVTYDYDSQGRLTKISSPLSDTELNITYDPLTIEGIVYDEQYQWDDDTDKETVIRYVSERSVLSNMEYNSAGYITKCTMLDEDYNYWSNSVNSDTYPAYFTYNSKNQLAEVRYDSPNNLDDRTTFNWDNNDNMISWNDWGYGSEDASITYSDTENSRGQWSLFWQCWGIEFQSGYFGVAPAHLLSSMTEDGNTVQLSYKLNAAGFIQSEKVYDEEDAFVSTYTYHYKNVKSASTANTATDDSAAQAGAAQAKHKAQFMFKKK